MTPSEIKDVITNTIHIDNYVSLKMLIQHFSVSGTPTNTPGTSTGTLARSFMTKQTTVGPFQNALLLSVSHSNTGKRTIYITFGTASKRIGQGTSAPAIKWNPSPLWRWLILTHLHHNLRQQFSVWPSRPEPSRATRDKLVRQRDYRASGRKICPTPRKGGLFECTRRWKTDQNECVFNWSFAKKFFCKNLFRTSTFCCVLPFGLLLELKILEG